MLRISKLTDYAAILLSYLALRPEQIFSATYLAKEVHLALPTVSKILKILSEASLVVSLRGPAGGYRLSRPACEITLAEVIAAVEGMPAITECCSHANACVLDSLCTVKDNWQMINKVILNALASLTLSDMIHPLTKHPLLWQGIPIKVQGT